MKFVGYRRFFCDDLGWVGFSLGLHVSAWRLDVHVAKWILSFGRVPVYAGRTGQRYAVSNSFHRQTQSRRTVEFPRPRI